MTSLSRTGIVIRVCQGARAALRREGPHRDRGNHEETHERRQVEKELVHRDTIDLPEAPDEEVSGHSRNQEEEHSEEKQRAADDHVGHRRVELGSQIATGNDQDISHGSAPLRFRRSLFVAGDIGVLARVVLFIVYFFVRVVA